MTDIGQLLMSNTTSQNSLTKSQLAAYEAARKIAYSGAPEDRVELACRATTPPEILYYMARDVHEDVRINVAANTSTPIQADEILSNDASPQVRERVAEKLFREGADLNFLNDPRKAQSTNQILENFSKDPSPKIRSLLAEAVKMLASLSKRVAKLLAQDPEEEVATPILKYSPVLGPQDLQEIITTQNQASFKSAAIAQRHEVEDVVCEEIINHGDDLAVSMLLSNIGAKISQDAYETITDKVREHPQWQEPLSSRGGLPDVTIKKLALVLSGSLLRTLVTRNHISPGAMKDVMNVVKERVMSGEIENEIFDALQSAPNEPLSPYERAKYDYLNGLLTEDYIEEALGRGEQPYVVGAIAVMARAPYDAVQKAVNMQHAKALMSFIWRGGLSAKFGLEVQKRMAKMAGQKILYPRNGDEFPLTEREMLWQLELFTDLAG